MNFVFNLSKHRLNAVYVLILVVLGLSVEVPVFAQDTVDNDEILKAIRTEGFERSKVMEIAHHLTDVYGPRLTGSPSLEAAGNWSLDFLTAAGLKYARAESWEWGHDGWENVTMSARMISPTRDELIGEVLAWTPGTDGTVTAGIVHIIPPQSPRLQDLQTFLARLDESVSQKIVLVGTAELAASAEFDEEFHKHDALTIDGSAIDSDDPDRELTDREVDQIVGDFLLQQGALARINASQMPDGLLRAFANRHFDTSKAIPTVILRNEDFGRLARLHAMGSTVELELAIENRSYPEGRKSHNYIAEIPGSDLADEVVMLGGHLDSWHAATGATDNAAGSAIMIEAARILADIGVRPRRTIRLALWTGEEQGVLGSQHYVANEFGTVENPTSNHARFNGYVNVDTGTGRLEGALVFGNRDTGEMLAQLLDPVYDLGIEDVEYTDSRRVGGSDHTSFNRAGLPGISMRQNPVRYRTHTWHTNIDTYERLIPEELRQAAVVVATLVYQLATAPESLPRISPSQMPELPTSGH